MANKFEVKIVLSVNEVNESGKASDFFNSEIKYGSLPYEGVVAIEQLMIEMVTKLGDWGVDMAVSNGLGDKLAALGVKPAKK